MAVHMDIDVDGTLYRVTLSRDDAGNYVADAARATHGPDAGAGPLPLIRVVDALKENAMRALLDSLGKLRADSRPGAAGPRQAAPAPA